MDALIKPFEQALAPLFKGLPSLPENSRKALVKYWPILALVFGVLQLFAVFGLWQLGHTTNTLVDYANEVSIASGYGTVTPHLGLFYYLGMISLAVDALILLVAYAPLKAHSKRGWDLIFLGALINLLYGILIVFDTHYGSVGNLIGSLIGSAIGFYLLFQIRPYYVGEKTTTSASATTSTTSTTTPPESKPKE